MYIKLSLTSLILLLLFCASAKAAVPIPVVKGDKIINKRSSKQFIPRGVNWPSFEYACVDGWGYSHQATNRSGIRAMKRWAINTVRIPLNQDCWLGEDRLPKGRLSAAGYRRAVKGFVNRLNRQNIVAILDLHWSGPRGLKATGLRAAPDTSSVRFWRSVATTFRRNKGVMFDLFNEPHSRWSNRSNSWAFTLSWSCWARGGCLAPATIDTQEVGRKKFRAVGMNRLIRAIRSVRARQPIIVSGIDYANDLSGVSKYVVSDKQLIAGFHNYPKQICNHISCWDKTRLSVQGRMPLLATEIGQQDCGYNHIRNYINWADKHRIGYLAWAWWAIDEGCSNYALIKSWNGKPHSAYGTYYRSHLLKMRNRR